MQRSAYRIESTAPEAIQSLESAQAREPQLEQNLAAPIFAPRIRLAQCSALACWISSLV